MNGNLTEDVRDDVPAKRNRATKACYAETKLVCRMSMDADYTPARTRKQYKQKHYF